jgi:predicted DCC family thiol-disulfide oxidoreductase YuxK
MMNVMSDETVLIRPVLIFDGDCGFCTTAVTWLERTLPAMPETAPYQWVDLSVYGLSIEDAQARVWLVDRGRRYGGAAAVTALLRHQPSPGLRLLGWLGATWPWSILADAAYRVVARYRYRLPGGTPACRLPSST